ncbi:MAG: hypothetical protein DRN96_05610 [Thermoproteota archaeon]|nr:MAG: hypothetical protein DRN96_05610 [Candidatus Korarchaeota archaeon]RLG53755.1 MAG: hypothetical protein DRN99_06245 [Candidatus Korarchaeota archaeon]
MGVLELLAIPIREIEHRKARSFLTMLGVAIGVATIVLLLSVGHSLRETIQNELNELVGAGFFILPEGETLMSASGGILDTKIISKVKSIREVDDAIPLLYENGIIKELGTFPVLLVGVPVEGASSFGYVRVSEGRDWTPADEGRPVCGLGSSIADQLGAKAGDTIVVSGIKEGVTMRLKVVAILEPTGFFEQDQAIYVPLKTLQEAFHERGKATIILVQVKDPSKADIAVRKLKKALRGCRVLEKESILENAETIMETVEAVLLALGSISLFVGGIGVMNTIMTSVLERTREIGMLKAIGATTRQVMLIFLAESLLLGVLGGLAGSALSLAMVTVGNRLLFKIGLTFKIRIVPYALALGFASSIAISAAAGIYPSWRASQLSPIEAMRYG